LEDHWSLPSGATPTSDEKFQALFASEENETTIGELVKRRRLLNTFGNLTVLTKPLNASVSNGPYKDKRKALSDHSLLVLNREIIKIEKWDEDEIEARGERLFEDAKSLWPYPA